jgi:RNA polymerase sigma factor (sigma-70 family)
MEERWISELARVSDVVPFVAPSEPRDATLQDFDKTYTIYRILLRKIAIRKFNVPRPEADALVQDVFASYLAHQREVRDVHRYLIGAICNASRQFQRKQDVERSLFCDADVCAATPSDALVSDIIRNVIIRATLAKLGHRCRDTLRKFYLEGMKPRAIAEERDTSYGYIRRLLTYCRARAQAIYRAMERDS